MRKRFCAFWREIWRHNSLNFFIRTAIKKCIFDLLQLLFRSFDLRFAFFTTSYVGIDLLLIIFSQLQLLHCVSQPIRLSIYDSTLSTAILIYSLINSLEEGVPPPRDLQISFECWTCLCKIFSNLWTTNFGRSKLVVLKQLI
jgi:hypothetical protein